MQDVVIHDKVLQLYETSGTELYTPVRYHWHDGYRLFSPSQVQGSARIPGS